MGQIVLFVVIAIVVVFALVVLARSVRIIPQARAGVVERLGRYHKTLMPGLNILVPFIDRLRPLIDLREQVVSFPPQPVITEDNLVVSIDTVVFFQVTDARAATYEIANYLGAVEQLATTTLRNVVGGLNLEEALTSRDEINGQLRIVLDEATGKWGIRVSRVELKAIDPPASIQDSMEKQMRAERERRAVILTAEGTKQSSILEAEGARQSQILRAEGDAKAQVLRAQGEAEAITTVFGAIHRGEPDNMLLAYQYLQTLPKLAEGSANKLWVIPSELTEALKGIGQAFGEKGGAVAAGLGGGQRSGPSEAAKNGGLTGGDAAGGTTSSALADAQAAVRDATAAARNAANASAAGRPAGAGIGDGTTPSGSTSGGSTTGGTASGGSESAAGGTAGGGSGAHAADEPGDAGTGAGDEAGDAGTPGR
ncbi:SPFH/Band 7/PHB domain protein [Herbiconiux sp. VKM Ac-1786]|nr:SPFH/Band 7/PHB domain protein [Herbiconiux sp. VKM Ac-1786]